LPEKTAMLTCIITLPDLPHPVKISKNSGFWAHYLTRQNEFRFFRSINTEKKQNKVARVAMMSLSLDNTCPIEY